MSPGCRPVPCSDTRPAGRRPEVARLWPGVGSPGPPPARPDAPDRAGEPKRARIRHAHQRFQRRQRLGQLRPEGASGHPHLRDSAQYLQRRTRFGQPGGHGRIVIGRRGHHVLAGLEQVQHIGVRALHQRRCRRRVHNAIRFQRKDFRLGRGRSDAHRRQPDQFADVLAVLVRAEHLDPDNLEIGGCQRRAQCPPAHVAGAPDDQPIRTCHNRLLAVGGISNTPSLRYMGFDSLIVSLRDLP